MRVARTAVKVFLTLLERQTYARPTSPGSESAMVPTWDFSPMKCQQTMKATDMRLNTMLLMIAALRFFAINTSRTTPYATSAMLVTT
jgi:hypothetical protein